MKHHSFIPDSPEARQEADRVFQLAQRGWKVDNLHPNQEDGRADTRYDLGIYIHEAVNIPRSEAVAQKVCAVGLTILLCIAMFLFALAAINVIPLSVPIVASVFFTACAWMNRHESAKEI